MQCRTDNGSWQKGTRRLGKGVIHVIIGGPGPCTVAAGALARCRQLSCDKLGRHASAFPQVPASRADALRNKPNKDIVRLRFSGHRLP